MRENFHLVSRIVLGTAQFNGDYGISNVGEMSVEESKRILMTAESLGLEFLDTASSYRGSEDVIGSYGASKFLVTTKLRPISEAKGSLKAWIESEIASSLLRLDTQQLYALMLHRGGDLLTKSGDLIFSTLRGFRDAGVVEKIGISVYEPDAALAIVERYDLDIIQLPANIVDRRFDESGVGSLLHGAGLEVHCRSIFLQGLLLMKRRAIPSYFTEWQKILDGWFDQLEENNLDPVDLALSYVSGLAWCDRLVVGCNTERQIRHVVNSIRQQRTNYRACEWEFMKSSDVRLIDPSRWKIEAR